jgi:hypothetical protein
MLRAVCVLLMLSCATLARAAAPAQPVDLEPTPQETLALEYINRFRSAPAADLPRMIPPGAEKLDFAPDVDLKMFDTEIKALSPAPPLVFNQKLMVAARKHCEYILRHGASHEQDRSKPGFYGIQPADRARVAGYPFIAIAENLADKMPGVWDSMLAFVIDWGDGGTGGMQKGRGHRRNLIARELREIGIAVMPQDKEIAVVHSIGTRNIGRLAGGVIYIDHNANKFYDIGEGVGNIAISASDGRRTETWASGAYALELKHTDRVTLTASFAGMTFDKTLDAGRDNGKFDWIIDGNAFLSRVDILIAAAEKSATDGRAALREALALFSATDGIELDDLRRKRVKELVGDSGTELKAAKQTVLNALRSGSADDVDKLVRENQRFLVTHAGPWFKDTQAVAAQRDIILQEEQSKAKRADIKTLDLVQKELRRLQAECTAPELLREVDNLVTRLEKIRKKR